MRKQNLLLAILVLLLAITVALGIILVTIDAPSKKPPETDETGAHDETDAPEVKIPLPMFKSNLEEYEKYMDVNDEKYLILVNKTSTIDASYQPESLVAVKDTEKEIELSETAEKALEAMFIEMRKEGFNNVFVTSAYRDYGYQVTTFNGWVEYEKQTISADAYKYFGNDYIYKNYTSKGLTKLNAKDAEAVARSYSAYPGTSEHHTGLSVDLMTNSMTKLDESFAGDPVYPWLLENAWKFGFILRYPKDKEDITGYSFEPWHYRFVGRYHAYKIHEQGICLEEYLED